MPEYSNDHAGKKIGITDDKQFASLGSDDSSNRPDSGDTAEHSTHVGFEAGKPELHEQTGDEMRCVAGFGKKESDAFVSDNIDVQGIPVAGKINESDVATKDIHEEQISLSILVVFFLFLFSAEIIDTTCQGSSAEAPDARSRSVSEVISKHSIIMSAENGYNNRETMKIAKKLKNPGVQNSGEICIKLSTEYVEFDNDHAVHSSHQSRKAQMNGNSYLNTEMLVKCRSVPGEKDSDDCTDMNRSGCGAHADLATKFPSPSMDSPNCLQAIENTGTDPEAMLGAQSAVQIGDCAKCMQEPLSLMQDSIHPTPGLGVAQCNSMVNQGSIGLTISLKGKELNGSEDLDQSETDWQSVQDISMAAVPVPAALKQSSNGYEENAAKVYVYGTAKKGLLAWSTNAIAGYVKMILADDGGFVRYLIILPRPVSPDGMRLKLKDKTEANEPDNKAFQEHDPGEKGSYNAHVDNCNTKLEALALGNTAPTSQIHSVGRTDDDLGDIMSDGSTGECVTNPLPSHSDQKTIVPNILIPSSPGLISQGCLGVHSILTVQDEMAGPPAHTFGQSSNHEELAHGGSENPVDDYATPDKASGHLEEDFQELDALAADSSSTETTVENGMEPSNSNADTLCDAEECTQANRQQKDDVDIVTAATAKASLDQIDTRFADGDAQLTSTCQTEALAIEGNIDSNVAATDSMSTAYDCGSARSTHELEAPGKETLLRKSTDQQSIGDLAMGQITKDGVVAADRNGILGDGQGNEGACTVQTKLDEIAVSEGECTDGNETGESGGNKKQSTTGNQAGASGSSSNNHKASVGSSGTPCGGSGGSDGDDDPSKRRQLPADKMGEGANEQRRNKNKKGEVSKSRPHSGSQHNIPQHATEPNHVELRTRGAGCKRPSSHDQDQPALERGRMGPTLDPKTDEIDPSTHHLNKDEEKRNLEARSQVAASMDILCGSLSPEFSSVRPHTSTSAAELSQMPENMDIGPPGPHANVPDADSRQQSPRHTTVPCSGTDHPAVTNATALAGVDDGTAPSANEQYGRGADEIQNPPSNQQPDGNGRPPDNSHKFRPGWLMSLMTAGRPAARGEDMEIADIDSASTRSGEPKTGDANEEQAAVLSPNSRFSPFVHPTENSRLSTERSTQKVEQREFLQDGSMDDSRLQTGSHQHHGTGDADADIPSSSSSCKDTDAPVPVVEEVSVEDNCPSTSGIQGASGNETSGSRHESVNRIGKIFNSPKRVASILPVSIGNATLGQAISQERNVPPSGIGTQAGTEPNRERVGRPQDAREGNSEFARARNDATAGTPTVTGPQGESDVIHNPAQNAILENGRQSSILIPTVEDVDFLNNAGATPVADLGLSVRIPNGNESSPGRT